MIKLLMGGSPCTHWSIAQSKNRETTAEGVGWELFRNYLIAKEKFQPDFFLYENNKSAAQAIKDQISRELGVDLMYINSSLVSAQNRQRFYAFNWKAQQPNDRGILLKDILEGGQCLMNDPKSYCLTATYSKAIPKNHLEKHERTMVAEPIGVGYRNRREEDGKLYRRFETHGEPKSNALTTVQTDSMVAEPVAGRIVGRRINETGRRDDYNENLDHIQRFETNQDPQKTNCLTTVQKDNMVAVPTRVGGLPKPNGEISNSQAMRVYSIDGKSVNLTANGGGLGGKTGLYACPVNITEEGKSQTIKAQYGKTSIPNICCYRSTYGATGVTTPVNSHPSEQFTGEGKDTKTMNRVYQVKDGLISIKGKQYPIKLPDGSYVIRKLTPVECERLQTLPDGYTASVSNTQRYKALGNGWTAEVIIHILQGALKDVPKDEEIIVLSMYDGIGTGRYCLDKMGFTNVTYHAYEIDKWAIKIAMDNYPDIIQHGDAFDVRRDGWTI